MEKIEVIKTELVWPGKYNEDGSLKEVPRVNLPFQVIETINESRATRETKKAPQSLSLFDIWEAKEGETFEEGWKNKLIWGDNLLVMGSLGRIRKCAMPHALFAACLKSRPLRDAPQVYPVECTFSIPLGRSAPFALPPLARALFLDTSKK